MRILIGIDQPLAALGLTALLGPHHDVIAILDSGRDVLEAIPSLTPDILIIDAELSDPCGMTVLRGLRSKGNRLPVVLIDRSADSLTIVEAIQLGVSGVVLHKDASETLLTCLSHVGRGARWFDQSALFAAVKRISPRNEPRKKMLTNRELDVACLVAAGQTNRVVGRNLGISEGTVKAMLHAIFDKTDARSRAGLVGFLKDHHLI